MKYYILFLLLLFSPTNSIKQGADFNFPSNFQVVIFKQNLEKKAPVSIKINSSNSNMLYSLCSQNTLRSISQNSDLDSNSPSFYYSILCPRISACEINISFNYSLSSFALIDTPDTYFALLMLCPPVNSSSLYGTYLFETRNPSIPWISQLSLDDRFLVFFSISFAGAWIILLFYSLYSSKFSLNQLISFAILARVLFLGSIIALYIYIGNTGQTLDFLIHLPDAFKGLFSFLFFQTLMLTSKGYCVSRIYIAPVEWRNMLLLSFVIASFQSMNSAFNWSIGLLVYTITIFTFIYSNHRQHLTIYTNLVDEIRRKHTYTPTFKLMPTQQQIQEYSFYKTMVFGVWVPYFGVRLHEPLYQSTSTLKMNQDWDIVGIHEAKLWILYMNYRINFIFVGVVTVVRLSAFLQVVDGYFLLIFEEVGLFIGFVALVYVYRDRGVFQYVQIPALTN